MYIRNASAGSCWKDDIAKKSLNIEDTRHKVSVSLAMGINLQKKMFQALKTARQKKKKLSHMFNSKR